MKVLNRSVNINTHHNRSDQSGDSGKLIRPIRRFWQTYLSFPRSRMGSCSLNWRAVGWTSSRGRPFTCMGRLQLATKQLSGYQSRMRIWRWSKVKGSKEDEHLALVITKNFGTSPQYLNISRIFKLVEDLQRGYSDKVLLS